MAVPRPLPVIESPIYYQKALPSNIEDYESKDNFVNITQHPNIMKPKTPTYEQPVIQRISPSTYGFQQLPVPKSSIHNLSSSVLPETTDKLMQRITPVVPCAENSCPTKDVCTGEQCNPQSVVRSNCKKSNSYFYSPPCATETSCRSESKAHAFTPTKVDKLEANDDVSDSEQTSDCSTFEEEEDDDDDSEWQQTLPSTLLSNGKPFQLKNVGLVNRTLPCDTQVSNLNCKSENYDVTSEAAYDEVNHDYSEDLIITEGSEASQQRRSVFERLGGKQAVNQACRMRQKPVSSRLDKKQLFTKRYLSMRNGSSTSTFNGFINRKRPFKKYQGKIPLCDPTKRNSTKDVAPSIKVYTSAEDDYSGIPSEIHNGDADELNGDDEVKRNFPANRQRLAPVSTRIISLNPPEEDGNFIYRDEDSQELYTSQVYTSAEDEYSSDIPNEIHNGDADPELNGDDEVQRNCSANRQLLAPVSSRIISMNPPEEDGNCIYSDEDSQESYTSQVEVNRCSSLQRLRANGSTEEKSSQSDAGIAKLSHQETLNEESELDSRIKPQTPSFYNSSYQTLAELQKLKDPTSTNHPEKYYLAWAERRKRVFPFHGIEPKFVQLNEV